MYWLEDYPQNALELAPPCVGMERPRSLLLIDDDPWFRAVFRIICESRGISVATFSSLADMPSVGTLRDYDVVIVDYFLESFTGAEIAEYVDAFFNHVPVMLISGSQLPALQQAKWPQSIRCFLTKTNGAHSILNQALQLISGPNSEPERQVNTN